MTGDPVVGVRLFVPGAAATTAQWQSSLGRSGLTLDDHGLTSQTLTFRAPAQWIPNDGSFGAAFGLGSTGGSFGAAFGHGTMSVAEQQVVAEAGSALVLDLPVYLGDAAAEVAILIATLGDAGALGVRLEQSKLGWPVRSCERVLESGDPWLLYRCAVVVLWEQAASRPCGMHTFGPDRLIGCRPRRVSA